ncbi:MAG: OmpA family protein [Fulvivirga sp.]
MLRQKLDIKLLALISCLFFSSFVANGQKTLWANKVIDFSTERKTPVHMTLIDDNAYKANQVLGEPNIFPGADGSTRAWTPKKTNRKDYIIVGFEEALQIRQIAIAESINPTAIAEVYAYDRDSNEYLLNTFKPKSIPLKGRLLNLFFEQTHYAVMAVKVVIDGETVPGYNGIDAIAISEATEPISIDIAVAEGIYTSVKPEKLSENVNSPYKDLKPLVSPDDKTLFLSRVQDPHNIGGHKDPEDIWVSKRGPSGEWELAKNLGAPLNNDGPNFICSAVPFNSGYVLLLGNRYKKNKMIDGLSMVYKLDSSYSEIRPVNIENQENFSPYANYQLSHNRDIILMSVQRRNTFGQRDIYVTFLKDDGNWTTPKNLGSVINTSDEESTPYLGTDGRTLYFSSKGHLGFGGSDIYVSKRLDDTWENWSEPENLGPLVNTAQDEIFFHIAYNNRYAYYTQGNGVDADIFRFELPTFHLPLPVVKIEAVVVNEDDGEPIEGAEVSFNNLSDDIIEARQLTNNKGQIDVSIPSGYKYQISVQAEGFVNIEDLALDFTNIYDNDTIVYKIEMTPVKVGQRIALDNIYFDFDKATLRPESQTQLNKVFDFLDNHNKVKIELDGHTCSIGQEDYNQKLSEDRALAVKQYLIDKGIKDKRLTSFGFGESQPKESNETSTGREQNRRVEFVIKEK